MRKVIDLNAFAGSADMGFFGGETGQFERIGEPGRVSGGRKSQSQNQTSDSSQ
jgi:hypothetical protein